jgi:hypothetical protein
VSRLYTLCTKKDHKHRMVADVERWGTMDQNKPLEDGPDADAAARALAEASREDDWATDGMDSVKPWSTARASSRALQVRPEPATAALTGARGYCLI